MHTPHTLSFEFFPTKTEQGRQKLAMVRQQLKQFNPVFFSCTYGAGGSTREGTLQTIQDMLNEGLNAAPHLACIGASYDEVKQLLQRYYDMGVKHIVALRGDAPSGMGLISEESFQYAEELVRFIRQEFGQHFYIEVAAYPEFHPQAKNAQQDVLHFVQKCQAGADSAITQFFYNTDAYFHFVDAVRAQGIQTPIVPGIMPIFDFAKLSRFTESCGAEIPRWLRLKLQSYGDDTASIKSFGLDVVTQLCDTLLSQGVPGLHFYTLNQAGAVSTICERLGF